MLKTVLFAVVCCVYVVACATTDYPAAALPVWQLEEDLRLAGSPDGSLVFDQVRDIDVLRDGRLVVLETSVPRVAILDSTGRVLRTFGSKGNGPEELANPTGIAVAPDGEIVIADFGNNRFTVLSNDGGFLRTAPLTRFTWTTTWGGAFDATGALLDPTLTYNGERTVRGWVRRARDLSIPDTVPLMACDRGEPPPGTGTIPLRTNPDKGLTMTIGNALPAIHSVLTRDGTEWAPRVFGESELALRRAGLCDEIATLTLRGERAAVPQRERDMILQSLQDYARQAGAEPPDLARVEIPERYPWYTALYVDDADRLWVLRLLAEGRRFDVFDNTGRQVATVPVNVRMDNGMPCVFRGDRLYSFVMDANGSVNLVSWRIVR